MTAKELAELLAKLPPTANVKAWDFNSEQYEDVTGVIWDQDGTDVLIETDEL